MRVSLLKQQGRWSREGISLCECVEEVSENFGADCVFILLTSVLFELINQLYTMSRSLRTVKKKKEQYIKADTQKPQTAQISS